MKLDPSEWTAPVTERPEELDFASYHGPNPYTAPVKEWEHLEFDDTCCARGHLCASYDPGYGTTRVIGSYLGVDSEGVYPVSEWRPVWYFPSAPRLPICEDCAAIVADLDCDTVFVSDIADASWFIDRAPADSDHVGKFYAWVGFFAPDHGLDHEIELGVHATVGAAREAITAWGAERNRELDKIEASLPEDADMSS